MTMRSKQWYTKTSRLPNSRVNSSIGCHSTRSGEGRFEPEKDQAPFRQTTGRGQGLPSISEVRYIQQRAAVPDGRLVTLGQLILFSTETGDAWLLDTEDRLATRIAQEGVPLPIHIEDTDTSFSVEWKGGYRVEGTAFIYADKGTGRVVSILGYPTDRLSSST